MRCEPPMPAQFISTRATPCAASAFASAALTCSSSVTSAWRATPFTSAATFSAFSLLWSMMPILAPLAATARAMAAKGANIGVLDQSKENAEKVAAEVKGIARHADITDEEQVKAALAKAEEAHGVARVLMNCAGIGGSQRIVGKDGVYPLAKFVRIINVNLIGTFNVLRLFAERLAPAAPIGEERGVAINTASVAAYEGQIGQIAYSASKGGVVGMTLPAARDFASLKIRVNAIAPGLFLTPLLMGLNEEARKSLGAQVPHPARLGDASEYGNLAVHIVENAMLNGETIRLDGAIRMAPR